MASMSQHWGYSQSIESVEQANIVHSPLVQHLIVLWLMGALVLLPLDIFRLPLNVTAVDLWMLMALPILWLFFLRGPQVISLSYLVAIVVILVASFASTFGAPAPRNGIVVIVKEVFIFVWFYTLAAVFAQLSAKQLRSILAVWSAVVFLHGFIILGQFLSPSFWRIIVSVAGTLHDYEFYRPAGLFMNANSAAFFQLLGFVPVLLVSPSRKVGMILGLLLLPTMLATGSMGAALAFAAGLTVAVAALCLSGYLITVIKLLAQLAAVIVLAGAVLFIVISQNERYRAHFEHIFLGRAERSSEGRFDLWGRGFETLLAENVLLWGIGPENFRVVDHQGKQLHNDLIAFSVERGLLGVGGLALFALFALSRAASLVYLAQRQRERARLVVVVFLGAVVAAVIESLTHQAFHFRELWIILALQEAVLFQMVSAAKKARLLLSVRGASRREVLT
ncbi:MAG: O-antigen ligase family protein [Caldilineaceae bacterium]